jgi:hypothetical protein
MAPGFYRVLRLMISAKFVDVIYGRHFEPGQLQFITTSTHRRTQLFHSQRFRWTFVEVLRQLRQELFK